MSVVLPPDRVPNALPAGRHLGYGGGKQRRNGSCHGEPPRKRVENGPSLWDHRQAERDRVEPELDIKSNPAQRWPPQRNCGQPQRRSALGVNSSANQLPEALIDSPRHSEGDSLAEPLDLGKRNAPIALPIPQGMTTMNVISLAPDSPRRPRCSVSNPPRRFCPS